MRVVGCILFVNLFGGNAEGGFVFNAVAVVGDRVPNLPSNIQYAGLGTPSMNDSGEFAFTAEYGPYARPGSRGLIGPTGDPLAPLGVIARVGGLVPGLTDQSWFSRFGPPRINNRGEIAFMANVSRPVPTFPGYDLEPAVFGPRAGTTGRFSLLARNNDHASGFPSSFTIESISPHWLDEVAPLLNDAGRVVFEADVVSYQPIQGGLQVTRKQAIYGTASTGGSEHQPVITLQVNQPMYVDGLPLHWHNGLAFGQIAALNDADDIIFAGTLQHSIGLGISTTNDDVIVKVAGDSADAEIILREGDVLNDGFVFRSIASDMTATGDGRPSFYGYIANPPQNVFAPSSGRAIFGPLHESTDGFGVISHVGMLAPGAPGGERIWEYRNFGRSVSSFDAGPAMNAGGDIVYVAFARSVTSSYSAVFGPSSGPGSPITMIAREGMIAPTASEYTFDDFGQAVINDAGDIVFAATLRKASLFPVTVPLGEQEFGVYLYSEGKLVELLRSDALLETSDGAVFDVASFSGVTNPEIDLVLNNSGLLAIRLTSDVYNRAAGIFTVDLHPVPEPAAVVMGVVAMLGLASLRRFAPGG